ncbi:hypothetical protein A2372_02905 [Candidatus Wolfebacteria bacterium RIFOXYB1_FULL_54_12]|uniref:LTD domain-containing protein n=1 Tax=Candidatus Wolfebacteria bacterium RIFOXYB1_FULL_54_12 TaxID=1802559 RepID=A0A1F8DXQ6_9BACT|nr:MAG: hypothetical protein A2372_02905 [Candidatus Wolfebacteria bacterium RIFOXYB1_FULL_54_12]
MENRKYRTLISLLSVLVSIFFYIQPAGAYEVDTHAYLTKEAIELYNKNTEGNKISSDLQRFIIDGAKHEDDLPRPQNHFYDPINNEGLNDGMHSGQSAKAWAGDSNNQKKIGYALLSDSSLTSVDWGKIKNFYPTADFTWNTAIKYWLKGDKEMAMEALGHAMHLVEDMGVPEHTRNDAHTGGSKYEEYVGRYRAETPDEQFKTRLGDKKPITLAALDEYFDGLARYANKYFYSPGSIGAYNFPEINYKNAESKSGVYFIGAKDDEGVRYYLGLKAHLGSAFGVSNLDLELDNPTIFESYWSLLSVRTVRYGAGVIDQFFRDVEKARNDPDFLKEEKPEVSVLGKIGVVARSFFNKTKDIVVKTGSFFSSILSAIGNGVVSAGGYVGGLFTGNNGLTNLGITDIGDPNGLDTGGDSSSSASAAPTAVAVKKDALAKKDDEINALKLQVDGLQKEAKLQDEAVLKLEKKQDDPVVKEDVVIKTKNASVEAPLCAYGSANRAGQKEIVINEVAWMGGVRSASDEWIELKNISTSDVDISEWQLLNEGGGVKVRLGGLKNPIIKAGGFVLLERTDNNSAVGATADLIYSGALANTNDGLKLFTGSCAVADEVAVASKWAAGSNDTKQTMERRASGGWQTSVSAGGTPKKKNSAGVAEVDKKEEAALSHVSTQSGVGGDPLSVAPQFYPIVINEIMYDVPGADGGREWVELYNAGTSAVDISDWKLLENETNHALTIKQGSPTIPVGGYVIIADDVNDFLSDNSGFVGPIFDSTFSLSNDGEALFIMNGSLTIDSTLYASSTGATGNGFSLQLFDGTWSAASSTPGRVNVAPVVAEAAMMAAPTVASSQSIHDAASYSLNVMTYYQSLAISAPYTVGSFSVYGSGIAGGWKGGICEFNPAIPRCTNVLAQAFADINMPVGDAETLLTFAFPAPPTLAPGMLYALFVEPTGNVHIAQRLSRIRGSAADVYASGELSAFGQYAPHYISERVDPGIADMYFVINTNGSAIASSTSVVASTASTTSDEIPVRQSADLDYNGAGTATSSDEIPDQVRDDLDVVINEIMYDLSGADDNREWIEVYNAGTTTADIGEWKFYENETHHGLAVVQGVSVLPAGGYAVIAASTTAFLNDNPGYGGTLLDSAFSLSNTGEALALKNSELIIDSVTYASSTGANGYGMSLQKFDDGWHAASSTPGVVNVLQAMTSDEILKQVQDDSAGGQDDNVGEAGIATTTPQSPVLAQLDDTAKSYTNPTSAFYQTVAFGLVQSIRSFRIAAEGISGRWKGGVCEFDAAKLWCAATGLLVRVDADVDMVSGAGKTALTFLFASDILLDTSKTYALFVEPTSNVSLRDRFASIYGSASNAYAGGGLYGQGQNWGISGLLDLGIADMYFEVNVPETVVVVPPEEEGTATTTPDIVMDPVLPIATSTEETVSSE